MSTVEKALLIEEIALHIMTATDHELQQMTRYLLAERFKVNESHLSTLFHRHTKTKLSVFIDNEKMFRARCRLHQDLSMNIDDLSSCIGIAKTHHFRQKFQRLYNVHPGKYKKTLNRHNGRRDMPELIRSE